MPRRKGMTGPGARAMGGAGVAPTRAPTPMAGRPPMGAAGGLPGGLGGMAGAAGPPRVRPPGAIPAPGGAPVARSPAAGMGGAAGFKKGGDVGRFEEEREEKQHLAMGGPVHHGGKPLDYPRKSEKADSQTEQMKRDHRPRGRHSEMSKQISEGKAGFKRGGSTAFAHGGPVGLGGADAKPRVGRDRGTETKSK